MRCQTFSIGTYFSSSLTFIQRGQRYHRVRSRRDDYSEFQPSQQVSSSASSGSHHHQHSQVSDSDPSASVQDVSPAVQPECHQSDLKQDILQLTMNDHQNFDIPPSISNQSNIDIQKFPKQQAQEYFLDICSGVNHPLSSAILQAGGSVCTFDILIRNEDNLLNDESYEALLRLSCSRQVRYGSGSPSCCEYSRLKLKPGVQSIKNFGTHGRNPWPYNLQNRHASRKVRSC